jgi:ATP-dependent DNA helicase RecG
MHVVFGRYVHPTILPCYEEVALNNGRRVAVITIGAGVTKPYVLRHNDREDIYVRVGTTSRLASREQQARLFASGAMIHPETIAVSGTGLSDLSGDRLSDYLVGYMQEPGVPLSDDEWRGRLTGLGFMTPASDGRQLCSIAGLVLFGRNPRRALPQAGIGWMVFEGNDKAYRARDDAIIDGPLVAKLCGRRCRMPWSTGT